MKTTLPISLEPVLAELTALAAKPELTPQITTNGDRVDHICDYKILQQDLSRAAKRTLTNLKRGRKYHKVLVLAIYWHKDLTDRPHLALHAERLLDVFRDKFGYEIDRHILEKDDAYKALNKKLVSLDDQLSSKTEDNLLVLYYGGHGGLDEDDSKARLWFPSLRDAAKRVDWNKLQTQLGESEFDILFLFDCCYAMSMPNRKLNWHKRCEIVAASGAREKAGGRPETSFTSAVAGLLEDDFKKFGETNAWRLGSIMKSVDYNKAMLKSTPDYEALCPRYSTISLVPRDGNSHDTSGVGSNTFHDTLTSSDARIIFSLAMTNVPTAKDFQRMLDVLPPTVTEFKVDVSDQDLLKSCGLFQSNSALALLSVPVWFWCAIATNPAYKYISLVRSENLLEQARREAEQQALTLNYCSIGVQTEESVAGTTLSDRAFVYDELPDNAIRLLEILEQESSHFAFRLKTYQLNEAPDFNALSYVWGQSKETHKVPCWNGSDAGDITVTANLFNALPFLSSASSRPIWIDAVCINQGNNDEKAIVVPNMDKIYGKAAEVLVWLGPSSEDGGSDLAMDMLRWLSYPQERQDLQQKLCTPQGSLEPLQLAAVLAVMRDGVHIREASREVESLGLPKVEHALWSALPALYQREWFYRVWTFQEIMLAGNAIVLCGDRTIPWKAFQQLGDRLGETELLWVGRPDGQSTFSPLRDLENLHQSGEWFWLYLRGARDRFCRFQEDRIYGMLSLAPPSLRAKIPVVYRSDDPDHYIQVYRHAAIAFLEEKMLELVLEAAPLASKPKKMPSWVPDWSQRTVSNPPPARFQADLDHFNLRMWSLDSSDNNILLVRGQQIDVVEEVIDDYSYHWPNGISGIDGPADKMLQWLNRCEALTRHTVASDEAAADTLWETLVVYSATRNQFNFPPDPIRGLAAHRSRLAESRDSIPLAQTALPSEDKQALGPFLAYVGVLWPGKVFFSTKGGTVGIADKGMAAGDPICMFFSANKHFVLGPFKDGTYSLKSVAYVHGMMEDVEAALRSRGGYKPIEARARMFRIR